MILAIAYALVAALGVVMGLIGAGGSIMIVPVLVYLLEMPPTRATGQSLFVIGMVSLFGAMLALLKREGDVRTAATFASASLPAAYLGRGFILPAVPDPLLSTRGFTLPKEAALMLFFAFVMTLAARSMLASRDDVEPHRRSLATIALIGFGVGLVTGVLGAGGGFIIVPALTLMAGVPMKPAVGTSLLIIAANSAVGFTAEALRHAPDWPLLVLLSIIAMAGMAVGTGFRAKASPTVLRRGFGIFVLGIALLIVVLEVRKLI